MQTQASSHYTVAGNNRSALDTLYLLSVTYDTHLGQVVLKQRACSTCINKDTVANRVLSVFKRNRSFKENECKAQSGYENKCNYFFR